MQLSLHELTELTEGQVGKTAGSGSLTITGFAALDDAVPGDVSFFSNSKYLDALRKTEASAVFVPADFAEDVPGIALVRVENPSRAFAAVVRECTPAPLPFQPGIHPAAVIDPSADVDAGKVCIDAGAVIGRNVCVGAGTHIKANAVIGDDSRLGESCLLYGNVTVYHGSRIGNRVILHGGCTIGSDGFGFEFIDGNHQKIEQVGYVQIDDDVEIGANSTIDRARFGKTWIQQGTKIDNLVQIGHNVRIGKHCVIVAACAIAGSARIGDNVTMAAQCGVAGHLEIGSRAILGGRSGVTKSLPGGQTYLGYPPQTMADGRKTMSLTRRLPELFKRLRRVEQRVESGTAAD